MHDWFSTLWSLIDIDVPGLSAGCFGDWLPADVADSLMPRWLQETSAAEFMVCPECGDHEEEVVTRAYPGSECRSFVPCPEYGRVEIHPEELRQWRFDLDAVAASVALSLSLSGNFSTAIPRQLWKLGRTIWQNKSRDLWFVRGLAQLDEIHLKTVLRSGLRPILLTSGDVPDEPIWESRPPAIVSLSRVSQWCHSEFRVDRLQLLEHVAEQDQRTAERKTADVRPVSSQAIRRQVKEEIAAMLTDDLLVAAFKEHGSLRKAADALTIQTKQVITKDRIDRALRRCGVSAQAKSRYNSNSVRRTVAVQRCDSQKIISNSTEAIDWQ